MTWLANAGMGADAYDAVLLYTSPYYFYPEVAREAIDRIVGLFS